MTKNAQGEPIEAFNILADGGMGRDSWLAKPIAQKVPAENVVDEIAKYLNNN